MLISARSGEQDRGRCWPGQAPALACMRYQSGELHLRVNLIEVSRKEGIVRAMMMCSDEVPRRGIVFEFTGSS